MRPLLRSVSFILLCAVGLMLAACGGGGGSNSGPDPTIYFVNASADSVSLNYEMNEVAFFSSAAYLDRSTDFSSFPFISDANGGYDLVTKDAGTDADLDAENREFGKDTHSVVVTVGLKGFVVGEELKRLRSSVAQVDRNAPNGNKARLYIVHGYVREVGQSTPQIVFQNAGSNPQFFTGSIDFGSNAVLTVDSGTADWVAKRQDATADVIIAADTVTLDPSSVYLVLVSGIENDPDAAKQPVLTFVKLSTIP